MSGEALALLHACREAMGGEERAGQDRMCEAIEDALAANTHLMVQAGTGTGKSLGYLAPALTAASPETRVVISTATKALQRQLITKDIPAVLDAMEEQGQDQPSVVTLKGWANYACRRTIAASDEDDGQAGLFDEVRARQPDSALANTILAIREWAEASDTGDRDDLPFPVSERAWGHASISAKQCIGESCGFYRECFPRQARARALAADVVVTNHALLGTDALGETNLLGETAVAVIDEAHELIARIRQAATRVFGPTEIEAVARQLTKLGAGGEQLREAAQSLQVALQNVGEGLLDEMPQAIAGALVVVESELRAALEVLPTGQDQTPEHRLARNGLASLAEDIGVIRDADTTTHAVWVTSGIATESLVCAPLDVAGTLARRLLGDTTTIFTSATLTLGGRFDALARDIGLTFAPRPYRSLDVGSPFTYPRQGILYVASHLPKPPRSGLSDEACEELRALVEASGGGALGLFSSRAAVTQAAEALDDLDVPVYVQGDDQLPALVAAFREDPDACLLGTLSLWQGVDAPGDTCRLVVIDRIPFPRPSEPLVQARCRAVDARGGSSFREVSLTHAALLFAQGAGRLIRTSSDRGMVAVLDSRVATAGYGRFLLNTLPPLWRTFDREVAHGALARLQARRAT